MTRVDRSAYDVLTDDGPLRVPALPAPREPLEAVTVGDWLDLDRSLRLPRTSLLARGAASGSSTAQPLAANVDVVLVCAGLSGPVPLRRVERLLALAWDSGATPVVVLTKADLCADVAGVVAEVRRAAPGVEVVPVSAADGDVPLQLVPGTTVVLLGPSGAGKSTLLNALGGGELMATGEVRQVDGKGRHTTSHRELFVLPSGVVVIDTPGLRGVSLHARAVEGVARAFSDVEELAAACRFADCQHGSEPGCAVTSSVAAGDLGQDRVDAWRKLQRELAWQDRRHDARLQAEERSRWKKIHTAQRARGGRP